MHKKRQSILNSYLKDFNPLLAGMSTASPNNSKTLEAYSYTLLHYVMQGCGTFFIDGKAYSVHAGQAFLAMPGNTISFESSQIDPWALRWVGFGGSLSHGFSQLPPVFDVPEEVWSTLCDLSDPNLPNNVLSYLLSSELFLLYAKMLNPINKNRNYVEHVIDYVQQHYMEKISVGEIAAKLGLTRSYLTDLFCKQMGKPIQKYIIELRIMAAKQFMVEGCSVKQAALQCGFNDTSYFIKRFTKETGYTPSEWIQKYKTETNEFLKS